MKSIVIDAKRKKALKGLQKEMGSLGFNKIQLKKKLVVEKSKGKDMKGEKALDYRITFGEKQIVFEYNLPEGISARRKELENFSILLNALLIAKEFYRIDAGPLYTKMIDAIADLEKVVEKEGIDYTMEIDGNNKKYEMLKKRYDELVRSNEENARILLESERRREELRKKVESLEGMSEDSLKEELYNWLKLHSGTINVYDFANQFNVSKKRIEQGLNVLINEGYIKRK